eukprot:357794-Chlamydomonas_euryale.AAC.12
MQSSWHPAAGSRPRPPLPPTHALRTRKMHRHPIRARHGERVLSRGRASREMWDPKILQV